MAVDVVIISRNGETFILYYASMMFCIDLCKDARFNNASDGP